MKFALFSHNITSKAAEKMAELAGKQIEQCKVLFITTPANPYPSDASWLVENINELKSHGFLLELYDIVDKRSESIAAKLSEFDIVFVSGGNVFYFLYWVHQTNFKQILAKYLEQGGVYAGGSAGAVAQIYDISPFELLDKPDKAPTRINEGINLTDVITIPHWGNPKYQDRLDQIKAYYEKRQHKVYPLHDDEVIFIDGDKITIL